ncbi:unnamed protein product, partial [Tetraodon nigroviridis]
DHIPVDLRDPFYTDQYEQEHIKPPIIRLLLSGELYCRVCGLILHAEQAALLQSHQAVIQALSRKGVYVLQPDNTPVSELDLRSAPIKMSAHVHLIDALMMAYMLEMISVEKVVSSVKHFSNLSAKELPFDLEDAMLLWINKVTMKMREILEKELKMKHHLLESPSHQKSPSKWYWKLVPMRYRREPLSGRTLQHFPLLHDLLRDVSDGMALLAVTHFYCPELVKLEDICLKEVPSIADSVYNIQLLKEFSNEYLNKCFHLKPEDMLYSPPVLKNNLMVFIAELFWWFESVKPEFVQPRELQEIRDDDEADAISLARSISKDSLASNMTGITPKHLLRSGPQRSQHRLSGQSLLSHMHIEDQEEEIEEEELVAVIHPSSHARSRLASAMEQDELDIPKVTGSSKLPQTYCSPYDDMDRFAAEHPADRYCLEPLMPAVPKAAKEKSISLNKEEESGENHHRAAATAARKVATSFAATPQRKAAGGAQAKVTSSTPPRLVEPGSVRPPVEGSVGQAEKKEPQGFFLHLSGESECRSTFSLDAGQDSDSDIADLDEDDDDEEEEAEEKNGKKKYFRDGELCDAAEGESAKLREDLKVSEREDKEDASGQSSPCLSTASWASSCSASASSNIKMTSFAERKLLKLGLRDGFSSTSSSQKTTPDGSEVLACPPWQPRSDCTSGWMGKEPVLPLSPSVVPSELLQLHMQLEEQRRAIEYQKKKLETLSARQRLKLGKAAFLNIVKSGGKSDTLPLPLKHSESAEFADRGEGKTPFCKDDSCLDALKVQAKTGQTEGGGRGSDNRLSNVNGAEPDRNECSHSIDLLNEAISSIQQQMMQLSLQQDLLMKHVVSPPEQAESGPSATSDATPPAPSTSDPRCFAVHFVDLGDSSTPVRRPPKLSSGQRRKTERKQSEDGTKTPTVKSNAGLSAQKDQKIEDVVESSKMEKSIQRNATFRVHSDVSTQHGPEQHLDSVSSTPVHQPPQQTAQPVGNQAVNSGKEAVGGSETTRLKGQLIEVDLSELKDPEEGSAEMAEPPADSEPKNVLGFFFKDEEKAEDEMAKRRAAFLLKQQRKAEESRLRKQQLEAESELKRDEARRKAEEDRIRKEEEKARRELIKQEYLRRKQQALMEEQGLVKPRPRMKSGRSRPKSLHRGESNSLSRGAATRNPHTLLHARCVSGLRNSLTVSMLTKTKRSAANSREADLSGSHRGSTLSLATEADSVISEESQRAGSVCSMDSFPVLSRASSRNMERDWDNGSIASSITSVEYNGPKLFKEPSSKSNKPIIINAIAHCCLAGKVNESQKNAVLEASELERCESNHLIILFRDGGCQYRAIYSYSPDTEEMVKFTGTGPRAIGHKMVDKLYKYSSDRKQFTVIPAKTVSVSIDALTIHNHLWQVKRPG